MKHVQKLRIGYEKIIDRGVIEAKESKAVANHQKETVHKNARNKGTDNALDQQHTNVIYKQIRFLSRVLTQIGLDYISFPMVVLVSVYEKLSKYTL